MNDLFRLLKMAICAFVMSSVCTACEDPDESLPTKEDTIVPVKNDTIKNNDKAQDPDIPVWESNKGIVISSSSFAVEGKDVEITASINPENNYGVTGIRSMVIEWNGEFADSIWTAPFTFKKKVGEKTDSKLIVSVKVEYKTAKSVYVKNENISMSVCKENGILFSHGHINYSALELQNGDTLSGKIDAYIGDGAKYAYYIYIDDEVVHIANTFPDNYSYKLEGLSVGSHKVYTEIVKLDDDGNRISEQKKNLNCIIKIIK